MKRSDKGKSIARYLSAHSGIIRLDWDGTASQIVGPYPYHLDVVTDARSDRFFQAVRGLPDNNQIAAVIRYDKFVDGVDNAVVGCTLRTFAVLLAQHHTQYE